MADSTITRANERLKLMSGTLAQVGSALLAAAVVKCYFADSFDLEAGGWFLTAGVLMLVAWVLLGFVESEA